jgi:hypothetical protein
MHRNKEIQSIVVKFTKKATEWGLAGQAKLLIVQFWIKQGLIELQMEGGMGIEVTLEFLEKSHTKAK